MKKFEDLQINGYKYEYIPASHAIFFVEMVSINRASIVLSCALIVINCAFIVLQIYYHGLVGIVVPSPYCHFGA